MKNTQHGYKILTKILTKTDNIFQFGSSPKKCCCQGEAECKLLILGQVELELFLMNGSPAHPPHGRSIHLSYSRKMTMAVTGEYISK